jgi:hypothetical protein
LDGERAIPNCTQQQCDAVRAQINNYCKQNGWPVGHKVLVINEDGEACYCHCGGQPGSD